MPDCSLMIKPVSGRCNMRCTYCFYADELKHRPSGVHAAMSGAVLERVVRSAFAYADGRVAFAFQGGEPSLAGPDYYRELLRLEKKYNSRGLPVSHALQTNGLDLSGLQDVLREGQFLVGLSVDGTQAIHDTRRVDAEGRGTYARVLATADTLRREGIPYNILCVADDAVAAEATACYRELRRHGYLQFIACLDPLGQCNTALDPARYGRFLIETFRLYAKDFRAGRYVSVRQFDGWLNRLCGHPSGQCGMNGCCQVSFLVESNGDVFPCDFYALDEWRLGNIAEASLRKMAGSETARAFVESSLPRAKECDGCRWFSLCRGGCRRDREPFTPGEPLPLNRLCESYRMFFAACYDELCELARLNPPRPPKQG